MDAQTQPTNTASSLRAKVWAGKTLGLVEGRAGRGWGAILHGLSQRPNGSFAPQKYMGDIVTSIAVISKALPVATAFALAGFVDLSIERERDEGGCLCH